MRGLQLNCPTARTPIADRRTQNLEPGTPNLEIRNQRLREPAAGGYPGMDSITHGALGIAAALLVAPAELRKRAVPGAFIAAELPDLDVFLVSPADPLFSLQVHRHFTHALVMIPLLAVLGVTLANVVRRLFRRERAWRGMWLPAVAAAATHGLCDTWTSYGTHLMWPFWDKREAWHLVSVIDPLLTLPLLAGAVLGWRRGQRRPAAAGLLWVCVYLGLCFVQQHRAREAVKSWAAREEHTVQRLTVKPSFGNIMVWRGLYEHDGICQVVCVRPGITEGVRVLGTDRAALLDPDRPAPPIDALPPSSVQARDVRRFQHFSGHLMGVHPKRPDVIGDFRYASRSDRIDPLWGIVLNAAEPERHVKLAFFRDLGDGSTSWLWRRVLGLD
jgi:inner membrane protein